MMLNVSRYAALIVLLIASLITPAHAAPSDEFEPAILGLVIHGVEVDAVDALMRGEEYFVPADTLFDAIGIRAARDGAMIGLRTPIGATQLAVDDLITDGGIDYVSDQTLKDILNIDTEFDEERYALSFTPPWKKGAPILERDLGPPPEIEPDVTPPSAGLNTIHGSAFITSGTDITEATSVSDLEFAGHAFDGLWQIRYNDAFQSFRPINDFVWLREVSDSFWVQLGRQQTSMHPLLFGTDTTGAQLAWTNRPEVLDGFGWIGGPLVERYLGSARRFEGTGPPGGRVEMRVDDLIVSESLIDVNGNYEIAQRLPGNRSAEIELRLFEPNGDRLTEVIRKTVTASALLREAGTLSAVGLAGVGGGAFEDESTGTPVVSGRVSYAITDDLLVELAGQETEENGTGLVVGFAGQFGRFGTAYGSVGFLDGKIGYDTEYSGYWKSFELRARAREREDESTVAVDLNYIHSKTLRLGAVLRKNAEANFILPRVTWRPRHDLSLSIRPNTFGEFTFEANWAIGSETGLRGFFEEESGFVRLRHDFATQTFGNMSVFADLDYFGTRDNEFGFGAGLTGEAIGPYPIDWRLQAGFRDGGLRTSASLIYELRPGVSLYLDGDHTEEAGLTITSGISFDIGFVGGRLAEAPRRSMSPREGQIAGRVRLPDGLELEPDALEGTRLVIDGEPGPKVRGDGGFWVNGVSTGVRVIELEADELPIDYVIDTKKINAQVSAGAVTGMTFDLAVEVGAAGRVRDSAGNAISGAEIVLSTSSGEVLARETSNQFGLFRLDGLRNGTYELAAENADLSGTRTFTIRGEYQFGVDIVIE